MATTAPVLLFDGVCALCAGSVGFVLRHEREPLVRFVAIQSPEGAALAERFGVDPTAPDTFLFVQDGFAKQKSDGVLAVLGLMRPPWRWLGIGRLCPRPLRDWAYDRIAKHRYAIFGKRQSCLMPTPALRARFAPLQPD